MRVAILSLKNLEISVKGVNNRFSNVLTKFMAETQGMPSSINPPNKDSKRGFKNLSLHPYFFLMK